MYHRPNANVCNLTVRGSTVCESRGSAGRGGDADHYLYVGIRDFAHRNDYGDSRYESYLNRLVDWANQNLDLYDPPTQR